MSIIPVVLCGGSGSRMWPLSRGEYPKQFINLYGKHSLLQQTVMRFEGLQSALPPILVSNNEQRFLLSEQLRSIGVKDARVVLEPCARNTAPAISAAAMLALAQDKDACLLVLPSDHVIQNNAGFQKLIMQAANAAAEGFLVTFGIDPSHAHTGYGYIERGEALSQENKIFKIASFVEKPNLQEAQKFLDEKKHYWNSGIFMFKAEVYIQELAKLQPKMFEQIQKSVTDASFDPDYIRLDEKAFGACPADSIDYAIMEHTRRGAIIVAENLGWNDIGSWDALSEVTPADSNKNNVLGDVLIEDVKNCYLRSEHRMIAAVGLKDTIVVETADAILVAHKNKVQDVKKIVKKLNEQKRPESIKHRRVYRPWGSYDSIDTGARFQVKRIIVNPQASLSLQMHFHRAEHWIVVKGTARITNADQTILLTENQSTYIPIGTMHRLENPGKFPLELIEIQSGSYLGEDDIVRFEDVYGRVGA